MKIIPSPPCFSILFNLTQKIYVLDAVNILTAVFKPDYFVNELHCSLESVTLKLYPRRGTDPLSRRLGLALSLCAQGLSGEVGSQKTVERARSVILWINTDIRRSLLFVSHFCRTIYRFSGRKRNIYSLWKETRFMSGVSHSGYCTNSRKQQLLCQRQQIRQPEKHKSKKTST